MIICFVQIIWTHDNDQIVDNDHFTINTSVDEVDDIILYTSISINDASVTDAGTYCVKATNENGEESASASLIVNSMYFFHHVHLLKLYLLETQFPKKYRMCFLYILCN